jgi:hypothetical protein
MRPLCLTIVFLIVGCNSNSTPAPERARVVEPVVKAAPASAPASAEPGKLDPAVKPAAESVAAASPDAQPAAGSGASKSPVEQIIDKYADSGIDGVVDVKTDKNGVIDQVVIVGAAPISTVLGAADGLLTARREARLRAAGKFRQFLKEKVSIEEKSETERVVKLESKQGSDLTESGQKVSKNTEKYSTISEGMVRGLQVLGFKTVSLNPKEKVYVMVCGWDSATSNAVKGLSKDLDSDDAGGKDGQGGAPGERRELKDQSKVAPGADKFFKKRPPDDR